tara:strand:- start:133 stop:864 length:732 start_codon:yes stop_codon:yes gene_type:complete
MKKIIDLSPNFQRAFRSKKDIKFVIIHYTGMQSAIESINRLKNRKSKVSCHYFVSKKGLVTQMVLDKDIAWHAGKSRWKNYKNLNKNSIGIELDNKGHEFGYEKFPHLQIKSVVSLCRNLKKKYSIKKENFLGHSDIAPLRKLDPGEKFPWKKLSLNSIGRWFYLEKNKFDAKLNKKEYENTFFHNLYKIGYRYFYLKKRNKKKDAKIIKAFQRRYISNAINGKIDLKTLKISHFLAIKSKKP